jgi:hypothetical protein
MIILGVLNSEKKQIIMTCPRGLYQVASLEAISKSPLFSDAADLFS